MAKVHIMRWSCPYYIEDDIDPNDIYEDICPHFNSETCSCDLEEPWFDCEDYQSHYGCESHDFEEE